MTPLVLLDVILIVTLVSTAWFSLTTPDLLRSVVLFIAFGLLVALAWVRLQAPDVAIAEAAVGSGLTGALLLSALYAMRRAEPSPDSVSLNGRSKAVTKTEVEGETEVVQDKP